MAVLLHTPPPSTLIADEIEAWRSVPAAIAIDLAPHLVQIDPDIRPLKPPGRQPALFGRAVTVKCEPPDFGAVLHALEIAGPGDVLVIAASGNRDYAMIGEILCGHLHRRHVAGVICDGAVRDVATLAETPHFSVYARHITPRGPIGGERGEVNGTVEFGGRRLSPGDLIIGDDDGLAALTPELARSLVTGAHAKMAREADWIAALERGESVVDIFSVPAPVRQGGSR